MIKRGDKTFAYKRDAGVLVEVEVPELTCPVQRCSKALELKRELHQSGTNDIAWEFACKNHTFFYHPDRGNLVRSR
jgi:hypothetical protein